MEILVMAGQLLLGLTILVGVHELGHMLTAKWFGMRVEKFSIGFPPKIFGKQIGETEYMIGAIPLGGFVKITGMVDESLDTETLNQEPQPYEFRAKPAWQRLIVMLGGIIVNVITGILIFSLLTYIYGEKYITAKTATIHGIQPNAVGKKMGFQRGDKIIKINGRSFEAFNEVYGEDVVLGNGAYYTVERGSQVVEIKVPNTLMDDISVPENALFVQALEPFKVDSVIPKSPAARAGLMAGDSIVRVGGQPIEYFSDLQQALADNANVDNSPSWLQRFINWLLRRPNPTPLPEKITSMQVIRKGQPLTLQVRVDEHGTIGFAPKLLLPTATRHYSFLASFPRGAQQASGIVVGQYKAFRKIFRGEASLRKSVGGPIEIAQQYGGKFHWEKFWFLTGMLSMVLAFMNLLPIPALDGGHVMFLTYEMLSGRKPSDKFLENAQKVGMLLLLSLMAFVIIINPILKAIGQ